MKLKLLLVYGILKRGKSLDLQANGCPFLGEATLDGANLYRIGGGVGLKLNEKGVIHGEVFIVRDTLWPWLDEIEGNGFIYTRKVVRPTLKSGDVVRAWVYEHNAKFRPEEKIEDGVYRGDY